MRRLLFNTQDSNIQLNSIDPFTRSQVKREQPQIITTTIINEREVDKFIEQKEIDRRSEILRRFDEQQNQEEASLSGTVSLESGKKRISQLIKVEPQNVHLNKKDVIKIQFDKKVQISVPFQLNPWKRNNLNPDEIKKKRIQNEKFIIDKNLISNQKQIKIDSRKAYFPFEPYEVQVKYIQKVYDTLDESVNSVLESPTGTGKTLCLLSSVLSWVEDYYRKTGVKTKVIYMSRTHSQLKQVHKQLEKTCFRPNMALFASRDQMCIKDEFSKLKGKQMVEACGRAVKLDRKIKRDRNNNPAKQIDEQSLKNSCKYNMEKQEVLVISNTRLANTLIDIPIMKSIGFQQGFCPYFYPHIVKNTATLFLMPYNYLLDAYLLTSYMEMIEGSIIIFDEAHNVAQAACQGRSLNIQISNIQAAINELNNILSSHKVSQNLMNLRNNYEKEIQFMIKNIELYKHNFLEFGLNYLPQKKNLFYNDKEDASTKFFSKQKTVEILFIMFCGQFTSEMKKDVFCKRGPAFKDIMRKQLLGPLEEIMKYGNQIVEALKETHDGFYHNIQKFMVFAAKIHILLMPLIYERLDRDWVSVQINHFRLQLTRNNNNANPYTFGMRCLVPWLTFDGIKNSKPRSILLTSGTMKPLQNWERQLRLEFKQSLVNGHVIKPSQLKAKVINSGPSKILFNFTFENMKNKKQALYSDLIESLIQICRNIPNGILLVFPSFRIQNEFQTQFMRSPKKKQLQYIKHIVFEEKNSETNLEQYKKKALSKKGAILSMICRGRLSEGIDFPDGLCRAVIIVGIPYANISDPFISEKKNHLNNIAQTVNKAEAISGQQWYQMGTIRTINQALGRVIRHAGDYGMIFFFDNRYQEGKFTKGLPAWVVESMQVVEYPSQPLYNQIYHFFQEMQSEYKPSKLDEQPQQHSLKVNHTRFISKQNSLMTLMNNRHRFDSNKRPRRQNNDMF